MYALANGLDLDDETDIAALAATRCVPRSTRLVTAVSTAGVHSSPMPWQNLPTNVSYPSHSHMNSTKYLSSKRYSSRWRCARGVRHATQRPEPSPHSASGHSHFALRYSLMSHVSPSLTSSVSESDFIYECDPRYEACSGEAQWTRYVHSTQHPCTRIRYQRNATLGHPAVSP